MRLREVCCPPEVTQPANTGPPILVWGAEGACWRWAELPGQGVPGWGRVCVSRHWASFPISVLYPSSPCSCACPFWPPNCHGLFQRPWGQGRKHLDSVAGPSWGSGDGGAKADLNEFQNLSRVLVWAGEGLRGCDAAEQEGGSEQAREPS